MTTTTCVTCGNSFEKSKIYGPAERFCSLDCSPRCSIEDCTKRAEKRGWCSAHYSRWKRHGSTETISRDMRPASERWKDSYRIDESGCWIWTGSINQFGYGQISDGWASVPAHRFVWMQLRPDHPIPPGYHVDHLCRVTQCVNPNHLEPVTPRVNVVDRAIRPVRTHCKRGHEFSNENSRIDSGGRRQCRECDKSRKNEWERRNPDKVAEMNRRDYLRRTGKSADEVGPNNRDKTHCKHGHEFTPENTLIQKGKYRMCRTCQRESSRLAQRRYLQRKRGVTA